MARTVGQELKRFRTSRGMSQFDLAVCMQWKGTNPVIQIEKDRRLPRPDTIERLAKCIGLNYLELHYLNGLAGYIPPTPLPPLDYIIETLDFVTSAMEAMPYPAYVVDYQFRVWYTNPATVLFTEGDVDRLAGLVSGPMTTLDMVFDSRMGFMDNIDYLDLVQQDQVFRFKASNAFRQHESFFVTMPDRMQQMQPEDAAAFMKVWHAIDTNLTTHHRAIQPEAFYARLQRGDLVLRFPQGDFAFYMGVQSILHLGDLFSVVSFLPVMTGDPVQEKQLAALRDSVPAQAQAYKLWELIDVAAFLESGQKP